MNIKNVDFVEDASSFVSYIFKPQLRTLGPKYGKQLGGIKEHLSALDGNAAMDELEAAGVLKFMVGDTEVELSKDDLLIEMTQMEGYVSENDNNVTELPLDAIVLGEDGVFHISADVSKIEMPIDEDFKKLVDSVIH